MDPIAMTIGSLIEPDEKGWMRTRRRGTGTNRTAFSRGNPASRTPNEPGARPPETNPGFRRTPGFRTRYRASKEPAAGPIEARSALGGRPTDLGDTTDEHLRLVDRDVGVADQGREVVDHVAGDDPLVAPVPGHAD